MELIIDSADIEQIKELCRYFVIDGVTTNPSIIAREQKNLDELLAQLLEILQPEQKLFVEVIATDYQGIIEEAIYINNLRENTYAKIPCNKTGLAAIRYLSRHRYKTLATAVFSATQAYLAGKNGADYIAPYVKRMDKYYDGLEETLAMEKIIKDNNFKAKIMGASFENIQQIKYLMANNIDALTISTKMFEQLSEHEGTDDAINGFTKDWQTLYNRKTLR